MKKPTVIGFIPKKEATKKNEKKAEKTVTENTVETGNIPEETKE